MKQIIKLAHKDVEENHMRFVGSPCDGEMEFIGEWIFDGSVVPDSYLFECNKCHRRVVSDGNEASIYVDGIVFQQSLSL